MLVSMGEGAWTVLHPTVAIEISLQIREGSGVGLSVEQQGQR